MQSQTLRAVVFSALALVTVSALTGCSKRVEVTNQVVTPQQDAERAAYYKTHYPNAVVDVKLKQAERKIGYPHASVPNATN